MPTATFSMLRNNMNKNDIIVQNKPLIDSASYKLNYYSQLLFISALSRIDSRQKLTDQDYVQLDLNTLAETAGLTSTQYYTEFKSAAEKLRIAKLEINHATEVEVISFINGYTYSKGDAKLAISFNSKLIPYISELSSNFTVYKFKQISRFKCLYSARIYQLLIQRLDLSNTRHITLDELRTMFKLGKSYDRYSNIKTRILEPAITDINTHSDIRTKFTEVYSGRKVIGLDFTTLEIEPRPITKKQIEQEALPGETYNEVKEKLKAEKDPNRPSFWKKIFKHP